MKPDELKLILENHQLWLNDNSQGKRADLTSADLRNANLIGADLRDTYLSSETKFSLDQLSFLSDCNYYENNNWIKFKTSPKFKQLLIKQAIKEAIFRKL